MEVRGEIGPRGCATTAPETLIRAQVTICSLPVGAKTMVSLLWDMERGRAEMGKRGVGGGGGMGTS